MGPTHKLCAGLPIKKNELLVKLSYTIQKKLNPSQVYLCFGLYNILLCKSDIPIDRMDD